MINHRLSGGINLPSVYRFVDFDVLAGLEIFWKIAPMLGIAFWMGLFWRRMNATGAWASTIAAFGIAVGWLCVLLLIATVFLLLK